ALVMACHTGPLEYAEQSHVSMIHQQPSFFLRRALSLQPAGHVRAFDKGQAVVASIMSIELTAADRKRRACHHALIVLQANQQLRCVICDSDQMRRVLIASLFGQCNQGGPVVDRIDSSKDSSGQIEYVTNKYVDAFCAVPTYGAACCLLRVK